MEASSLSLCLCGLEKWALSALSDATSYADHAQLHGENQDHHLTVLYNYTKHYTIDDEMQCVIIKMHWELLHS